jgi:LysM repeat protein
MTKPIIALFLLAAVGCGDPSPSVGAPVVVHVAPAPLPAVDTDLDVVSVLETPMEAPPVVADLPEGPDPTLYTLRRGETLAHFARWSGQPVEEVARTSSLELDGLYAVGTEVALVLTPEERSQVESRRDAHHQTRANSYLDARGASGTAFYRVRTGDSAWSVAQQHQSMPVWLLESLNPSADLERLRPGQELLVPVFADTVVEVPPAAETESTGG